MSNTVEDDNTAFVVYVPPNGGDKTVESCLRLGAGPANQSTQDETTTYNDIVGSAATIGGLSSPTYNPTSGIALLTPGTINMVATGHINLTSDNVTNSNTGSSYTVTQEANGGHIVSASYTSTDIGTWATASFNQATNVAVTFAPLQASIGFVPSYALSGPLVLSNNYGLIWGSTVGLSVQATMARVVNIGWHTVVSNSLDGSSNQYYTSKQAQSSAAAFQWTSPVRLNYLPLDTGQATYCKTVEIASLVLDALAVAYAAVGLGIADGGSPATVQKWLVGAEGVAIACTALNGLMAASGVVIGAWVDSYAGDPDPPAAPNKNNVGATSLLVQDGKVEMHTGAENAAPSLTLCDTEIDPTETDPAKLAMRLPQKVITLAVGDPNKDPVLFMRGTIPLVGLGMKDKGEVAINDDTIMLKFGPESSKVKIILDKDSVSITTTGHSIKLDSSGIKIAGQNITIEGLTTSIASLQTDLTNMQKQVDAATQTASDAKKAAWAAQRAVATTKAPKGP